MAFLCFRVIADLTPVTGRMNFKIIIILLIMFINFSFINSFKQLIQLIN